MTEQNLRKGFEISSVDLKRVYDLYSVADKKA